MILKKPWTELVFEGRCLCLQAVKDRIAFKRAQGSPRLGGGSATRGDEQADRRLELLTQLPGKKVGGRGKLGRRLWTAHAPAFARLINANLTVRGRGDFLVRVERSAIAAPSPLLERHDHVGLAGAEPHLAGEHVV